MSPVLSPSRFSTESARVLGQDVRALLVLAAPMIATMVSRMAMGFIDLVMVSKLGDEAVAAASPAIFLIFCFMCLGMGLVASIQTYVSQALGRGDRTTAASYTWQGVYVAGLFFLLSIPAGWGMETFWTWVGHEPRVRDMEVLFCRTGIFCAGFAVLTATLDCFFNGIHKPGVTFKSVLVSLVFSVLANYVLIFGHFGFPALGIQGSAVATVVAWGVRAVMLAALFLSPRFHQEFNTRRSYAFDAKKFRELFTLGSPLALQWLLDIGAWFVFLAGIMAGYGTHVLAAANVAFQYMHLAFMPAVGIGFAVCSQVGFAIGQGKPDLAQHRVRIGLLVAGGYTAFIGLLFFLMPRLLMRGFSDSADVIEAGVQILLWAAAFQVLDGIGIVYTHSLRGAGDTRGSAAIIIAHNWGIFILGGWLIARYAPGLGPSGPWMICTFYFIVLAINLRRRFNRGAWRRIDLFDADAEDAATAGSPIGMEIAPPDAFRVEEARA